MDHLGEGLHQVHQAYMDPWRAIRKHQPHLSKTLSQHQVVKVTNLDNMQDYVSSSSIIPSSTSSDQIFGYPITYGSENAPMPRPLSPLLQEAETLLERLSTFDPFEYSNSVSTDPLHHRDEFTEIEEDWFMGFKLDREEAHRMHVLTKYAESNNLLPWDNEYTDMAYDEEFLSQDALDQEMDSFYKPSAPISQQIPSHNDTDGGYAENDMQVESVEYQQPQKPIASAGSLERSGLTVEVVPYSRDVVDKTQTNTPYFKDSGICMEDSFAAETYKPSPLLLANDGNTISWRPTENSDLGSSMFPDYEKIDGQEYNIIDYEHPFAIGSLDFPDSFTEGMPDVVNRLQVLTHGDDPRQYEEIDEADMEEIMAQVDEEISARFPRNVMRVSDEVLDDNAAPNLQLSQDLHAHFEYEQGTIAVPNAVHSSYPQTTSHGMIPQENMHQMNPNGVHVIQQLELSASTIEQTWQEFLNELDAGLPIPNTPSLDDQVLNSEELASHIPQTLVPEDDLTPTSVRKNWTVVLDRSTAENPFPPLHIPETTGASTTKASGSIESQPSMATSNILTTSGMDFTHEVVDKTSPYSQDLRTELQPSTNSPLDRPMDGYDGHTVASVFGIKFSPATTPRMQREVCNKLDALMPVSMLSQGSVRPPQNHHEEQNGATTIQNPNNPGFIASPSNKCMFHGSTNDLQHPGDAQFLAASVSMDRIGCNLVTDSSVNRASAKSSQQQNTEHVQTPTYQASTSPTGGNMSGFVINQEPAQTPQDRNGESIQRPSTVPSAQYIADVSSRGFVVSDQVVPSSPIEKSTEVLPSTTFAGTHIALPLSPVNQTEEQDSHSTPHAWSPFSDGKNLENRNDRNKVDHATWSMRNHPDLDQNDVFSDEMPSSVTGEQGVVTGTSTSAASAVDDENFPTSPVPFPTLPTGSPTTFTTPTLSFSTPTPSASATPTPGPKSTSVSRKFKTDGIKKGVKQIFANIKRASSKVDEDGEEVAHDSSKTRTGKAKKAEGIKRRYTKRKSATTGVADQDLSEAGAGSGSKKRAIELSTAVSDKKEDKICEPATKKPRRSGRLSNGTT